VLEDRLLRQRREIEARSRFQIETMISLQEAIRNLQVATARVYLAMAAVADSTGKWPKSSEVEGTSYALGEANGRVTMLMERLIDEGIRQDIKLLWSTYSSVVQANDRNESSKALAESGPIHRRVNEKLGEILRSK